jgi:hypothetical protein
VVKREFNNGRVEVEAEAPRSVAERLRRYAVAEESGSSSSKEVL